MPEHTCPTPCWCWPAVGFFLWRWMKSDKGATQMDRFKLKIPLLGDIWLKYQVAVFSRMLSTLLSGGLPLVPSLETAGESMQSHLIAHGIEQATRGGSRRAGPGTQPGSRPRSSLRCRWR